MSVESTTSAQRSALTSLRRLPAMKSNPAITASRRPRSRATCSDSTPRPRRRGRWQVASTAAELQWCAGAAELGRTSTWSDSSAPNPLDGLGRAGRPGTLVSLRSTGRGPRTVAAAVLVELKCRYRPNRELKRRRHRRKRTFDHVVGETRAAKRRRQATAAGGGRPGRGGRHPVGFRTVIFTVESSSGLICKDRAGIGTPTTGRGCPSSQTFRRWSATA